MTLRPIAVVTGASSGIGAESTRSLVAAGFDLFIGARRTDRLERLADELSDHVVCKHLDVTDPLSIRDFCSAIEHCNVLVNNAGGALGLDPIAVADDKRWITMYETNVLGTMRMTRALLPALISSGDGLIINIGSVAAFEPYAGGAGYNAAKAALRAFTDVLRIELLGEPVRVSEIDPGMVATEFSLVRFDGDLERSDAVYAGVTPLVAADIAECVAFIATRPSHVDIDNLVIRPRDQARVHLLHRDRTTHDAQRR